MQDGDIERVAKIIRKCAGAFHGKSRKQKVKS